MSAKDDQKSTTMFAFVDGPAKLQYAAPSADAKHARLGWR